LGRWKCRNISIAEQNLSHQVSFFIYLVVLYVNVYVACSCGEKDCDYSKELPLGWGSEGRKIAWVSCEEVCESRKGSGLEIVNIKDFNSALLGKWIWRLGSNEEGLWKEVLESKYGD